MENASKALLMAGGILLAMMILALLVYVATSMSSMAGSQDRRIEAKQLEDFNKTYEAYNKTRMYGTDIITVVNKAEDYNTKNDTEEQYKINITVFNASGDEIPISYDSEFKAAIFKCTDVTYKEGRIKSMTFSQL